MNKKSFKGFYRFSDSDQLHDFYPKTSLKEQFNIVQKVQGEGVEYEFMISFYNLGGKLAGRVEIFEDAFVAFKMHADIFEELSKLKHLTPDKTEEILMSLGYRNLTNEEADKNE